MRSGGVRVLLCCCSFGACSGGGAGGPGWMLRRLSQGRILENGSRPCRCLTDWPSAPGFRSRRLRGPACCRSGRGVREGRRDWCVGSSEWGAGVVAGRRAARCDRRVGGWEALLGEGVGVRGQRRRCGLLRSWCCSWLRRGLGVSAAFLWLVFLAFWGNGAGGNRTPVRARFLTKITPIRKSAQRQAQRAAHEPGCRELNSLAGWHTRPLVRPCRRVGHSAGRSRPIPTSPDCSLRGATCRRTSGRGSQHLSGGRARRPERSGVCPDLQII